MLDEEVSNRRIVDVKDTAKEDQLDGHTVRVMDIANHCLQNLLAQVPMQALLLQLGLQALVIPPCPHPGSPVADEAAPHHKDETQLPEAWISSSASKRSWHRWGLTDKVATALVTHYQLMCTPAYLHATINIFNPI